MNLESGRRICTGNGTRTLVWLAILLAVIAAPVSADEAARYSFASAQGGANIAVAPGGEGRGALYFYNVDGNRVTHVVLAARGVPSGWEARLDPPTREAVYEVNGERTKISENLPVEPSQLLAHETKDLPAGAVCIPVPGRGYALAKVAHLVVQVPEGEAPGRKAEILVTAEASWLGQTGMAAIRQAREFTFTVEVVRRTTGHSETLLPPGSSEPAAGVVIDSLLAQASWAPAMGAGALLALGFVTVAGRIRKRGRRS